MMQSASCRNARFLIVTDNLSETWLMPLRWQKNLVRYIFNLSFIIIRCYWAICCVASFSLCGWMTYNVWFQWQSNPVLIKLDREYASPEKTLYPTVTICPEVKTTKQKLDLTSALNNLSNLSHIE